MTPAVCPLTKEQITSYQENGYLIIERLFSPEECDQILQIYESHADENYSAILNLDRQVPEIRALLKDPSVVSIVEALHGEVVGVMTQIIFKKVGSPYARQAWNPHQDNSYPQVKDPGVYITVNPFLHDTDLENGTLYIFPGSHKEGLLPWMPTVSYREVPGVNPGNTVSVPEKYQRVDLFFKKGDTLFLHGNTIHGSYPNLSRDRDRAMVSLNYVTKGSQFNPGKNAKRMVIPLR